MKTLICHRPGGAFGYISDGWINALRQSGMAVERWDGTMGHWFGFKPDLYLGCSGHRQPIPSKSVRGTTKIAIHVNPFGSKSIPGIDESPSTIQWVVAQHPDAVFGYGFYTHQSYWDKWQQHGFPWIPMPTAGDAVLYNMGKIGPRNIGIGYMGGRWAYKSKNIDKYVLPLTPLNQTVIHGWGDWPDGTCKGRLDDNAAIEFYTKCRVAPCVSEPHTTLHGIDLPERLFKASLCGALPIHDPVHDVKKILPSLMVASDSANYVDLCSKMASREHERYQLSAALRSDILAHHTYHHRLANLFSVMGFGEEAIHLMDSIQTLNKKNSVETTS